MSRLPGDSQYIKKKSILVLRSKAQHLSDQQLMNDGEEDCGEVDE